MVKKMFCDKCDEELPTIDLDELIRIDERENWHKYSTIKVLDLCSNCKKEFYKLIRDWIKI